MAKQRSNYRMVEVSSAAIALRNGERDWRDETHSVPAMGHALRALASARLQNGETHWRGRSENRGTEKPQNGRGLLLRF